MDTSKRRFIRLAIATATAAGVALASPVVAVADESEVIEAAPIVENSDPPVVMVPTTEPLVIELIVEGDPSTDSTDSTSSGAEHADGPGGTGDEHAAAVVRPPVREDEVLEGGLADDRGHAENDPGALTVEHRRGASLGVDRAADGDGLSVHQQRRIERIGAGGDLDDIARDGRVHRGGGIREVARPVEADGDRVRGGE